MTIRSRFFVSMSVPTLLCAALAAACCRCPPIPQQASSPEEAAEEGGDGTATPAAYNWKNVTILGGGFVTGVIFSPAEKDLVYARTDIGGAYRYNPADQSWIAITDHFNREQNNYYGIETLAPDPVDPERVYMAVGTYTQSWAGTGALVRSTDRGQSWELTEVPFKMGGNENGRSNGERMAVDPNHHDTIFFGTRKNGLYKSEDAGKAWNPVQSFPVKEEPLGVGITFVLFDQQSGSSGKPTPTVYAGVASKEVGLYRSTDAGASWKAVSGQPKGLMPSHAGFDSAGILYLSYGDQPGPSGVRNGAIYKYQAKGDVWTDITPLKPKDDDKFGYGGLSVGAQSPGTVMVTTIDRWGPGDEVFRTTDGGKSWATLGPKAVRDDGGAKYLYWGRDKPSATGWMGDIDIDPHNPARVMYVTGQGIWASEDATEAESDKPTHWKFLNQGLEETAVNDLASPPTGAHLLSTMGDICGFRHDDLAKAPHRGMFDNPICGGGTGIDFAESKPEIVVRVGSPSHGSPKGQYGAVSADGGVTWTPFASNPPGSTGSGAVAISADGETIVWAPKDGRVSYSRDQGRTWTPSAGLPGPAKLPDWAPVNFRLASDRVNPKKFYIYDAMEGKAYATEDGGARFTETDSALPALPDWGLPPTSAQAVAGVEGDVWLTTGKELYHSTDSGQSYRSVNGVVESYAIGFGKAPPEGSYPAVYLIAKLEELTGIFRSDDGAKTWFRINDDTREFGNAGLIIGDPRVFGRAYLGTHGRGVLYGEPK
jgi:photosystem II stability/assembly factor-like uncharacterized protein